MHEAEEKVTPDANLPKKETRADLGDDGVRPLSLESRFEEAAVAVDKPGGTRPLDPYCIIQTGCTVTSPFLHMKTSAVISFSLHHFTTYHPVKVEARMKLDMLLEVMRLILRECPPI